MNNYPEAVAKIANDYLERVKLQLRLVPVHDQQEFLRELQSHLYEAYRQMPGEDDVGRILAVLRNLGEPAEVVSDRLPGAMVRSGARRSLPLYIMGGILIAMFGIPLGFGGVGVLVGLLFALAGIVIAYYATAGSILLAGAMSMLLALTRMFLPHLWDKLVTFGFIQMNGPVADFLDRLSPSEQRFLYDPVCQRVYRQRVGYAAAGKIPASRATFSVYPGLRLDAAVGAKRSGETAPRQS